MSNYVTLKNVSVGDDAPSGKAVRVTIEGEQYWIPYSQVRAIHRDRRNLNADSIEVRRWLAERENWDYED